MFKVFGFYKFIKIKSLKKDKDFLQKFLTSNNIRGTIIIANEGLNGTISGHVKDIDKTNDIIMESINYSQIHNYWSHSNSPSNSESKTHNYKQIKKKKLYCKFKQHAYRIDIYI